MNKKAAAFSILLFLFFGLISLGGNPHAYTWKLWAQKQEFDAVSRYYFSQNNLILVSTKFEYDAAKSRWVYGDKVVNNYIIADKNLVKIFLFAQKNPDFLLTFYDLKNAKNLISGKIIISFAAKKLTPTELNLLSSGQIINGIFTYKNNVSLKKYECEKNECAAQPSLSRLDNEGYLMIAPEISLSDQILKIIITPFALTADAAFGAFSLIVFLAKFIF